MNTKQFVIATLAGFITLFLLGFLFYGLLLMDFYAANTGSATGVARDTPIWWALGLGELTLAAFLTLVLGRWAGISTPKGGFMAGAIIGCLLALAIGLGIYATMNTTTITVVLVDVLVAGIRLGIAGSVIGTVLSKIE